MLAASFSVLKKRGPGLFLETLRKQMPPRPDPVLAEQVRRKTLEDRKEREARQRIADATGAVFGNDLVRKGGAKKKPAAKKPAAKKKPAKKK